MNNSAMPLRLTVVFAASGDRNSIPTDATTETLNGGKASFVVGFPPITRIALSSGGKPPQGQDFNGIFYESFLRHQWNQAGGGYPFDSAYAAAIGGYPKGAVVPFSTLDGLWLNTLNSNNGTPENTGGVASGWVPVSSYGISSITASGSANITLTALQASRPEIVISGVLTGNIYLFFPPWIKKWKVTNNTSGGFNVVCKTIGGSNTATLYPAGRGHIHCDGTNVYFVDATSGPGQSGGLFFGNGARLAWGYTDANCNVAGADGEYETDNIFVTPTFTTSDGVFGFNTICSVKVMPIDISGVGQNERSWLMGSTFSGSGFSFRSACKTQNATIRTRWEVIGF